MLAGRSLPETQAWLDRIARPPLAGRVRHIGYFEMSARRSIYEGARLLVQPSWEEGFGFPVLEAMTMGVPVVSANRGSLPEVLGDAGLLVDPQDAVAMAAAMHRMLTDGDFAQSCTASGISRSRRFDWAATAADVCEGYRLAIERRKNRG